MRRQDSNSGLDTFSSPQRIGLAHIELYLLLVGILAFIFYSEALHFSEITWGYVGGGVVVFALAYIHPGVFLFLGGAFGGFAAAFSLDYFLFSVPIGWQVVAAPIGVVLNMWFLPALLPSGKRKANKDTFGSAAWGGREDMRKAGHLIKQREVGQKAGVALGRTTPDFRLSYDDRFWYMGHVVTCAPTGAGKGVGAVIPTLLEYPGSVFVLDIKGENYEVTRQYRERVLGHKIVKIDPFGVVPDGHSDRYNVIDWLRSYPDELIPDSLMLADMLVAEDTAQSSGSDSHWEETAKDLLRGLIAYSTVTGNPSLSEVRRILTLSEDVLKLTIEDMQASTITAASRSASAFLAKADRERATVHSTALRHTQFLDDSRVEHILSSSSFDVADLKRTPTTVYLILPPEKVQAYKRLVRLLFGLFLTSITRVREKPEFPVMFLLDEFAQLGRLRQVEDSISLMRGYGAFFWVFVQDLSQLKAVYPKWQTFLANSAKQFFRVSDYDTAKYISEYLGEQTVSYFTDNETEDALGIGRGRKVGRGEAVKGRRLLTPDEVMRIPETILLLRSEKPYKVFSLNYLRDSDYRGRYSENRLEALS